jgi:hypothetical protein
MVDDGRESAEGKIHVDQLPLAVKHFVETMIGVDPNFTLEDWLIQKANEDLRLLTHDLKRERIQLEQRMHRLESVAKRLKTGDLTSVTSLNQTNLFDCFDIPERLKHLTNRIEEIVEEPHPASTFLSFTPGDVCDDPLLAVAAQMMLMGAQDKIGDGAPFVNIEELFAPLLSGGIATEECDEALDHLIMTEQIHEIDDNCFVPDE